MSERNSFSKTMQSVSEAVTGYKTYRSARNCTRRWSSDCKSLGLLCPCAVKLPKPSPKPSAPKVSYLAIRSPQQMLRAGGEMDPKNCALKLPQSLSQ